MVFKKWFGFIGGLSFLFFISIVQAKPKTYQFYLHTLGGNPDPVALKNNLLGVLGEGWSTDNDAPVGLCLNGAANHVGTSSGSISMDTVYTYNDVMNQLGYKVDGSFSLSGFNANAVVDYTHMLKDTNYSQTFIYRASIFLKNRHFVPVSDQSPLTWIGQQYSNDPVAFRAYCGDKFVSEQQIGGVLYAAVTFHFHTKEEKLAFNESGKADFSSFLKLSENLSKAADSVHQDGEVSMAVFQIGGDPTQLGRILGAKSGSTEAPVLHCSLKDLVACRHTINQILVYASQPDEGNFPSQFKEDDLSSPVGPGVIHNIFQHYATVVPVKVGPSLVTQDIIGARARLSKKYEASLEQTNEINAIINQNIPLSQDYSEKLNTLKMNTDANDAILREAGEACYDGDLSRCLGVETTVDKKLLPVDLSPFERVIHALWSGGVSHFFPYSTGQYIYADTNYHTDEIFTVRTFTKDQLTLTLPGRSVSGTSTDQGRTYQGIYRNNRTGYAVRMTFIPDFDVR